MVGLTGNPHTLWGLDTLQLHDRFWASRGVQVVRLGDRSEIVPHAELFLLTGPSTLAIFRLAGILDSLSWLESDLVSVRLTDDRKEGYRERPVTDSTGRLVRLDRIYEASSPRFKRVALTPDRELAVTWQGAPDVKTAWQRLRRLVRRRSRLAVTLRARVFDSSRPEESARFVRELVSHWRRPDSTIPRARALKPGVWADETVDIDTGPGIRGPLWIGAGRELPKGATAVGPAVMWDKAEAKPPPDPVQWLELEPIAESTRRIMSRTQGVVRRPFKRLFDIVFSLGALVLTAPLFPLVAILILIEDGRPIFFAHQRESRGGRQFGCLKFRSMRKNAEQIKAQIQAQNQVDGPQFYIENDPRLTRVGRIIRKLQIDELPQFINVLKGEMSVVGPRPSPFKENQYCPPWREARLSVRPGVTGLWQISRTRAEGVDFQEWIKFDIEYVERQSMWFDLWIIWRTVALVFRKLTE